MHLLYPQRPDASYVSGQYYEGLALIVSRHLADCLRYKKSCFANLNRSDIKSDDTVVSNSTMLGNGIRVTSTISAPKQMQPIALCVWINLLNNLT